MDIIYSKEKYKSEKGATFILADDGNYFLPGIDSRYQGFFIYDNEEMFKIIDGILSKEKVTNITNNFYNIKQKRKGFEETYWIYKNSLILEQDKLAPRDILLDIKKSYDNREWGRIYNIEEPCKENKNCIVICFKKQTDKREDNSEEKEEFNMYLAIKTDTNRYKIKNKWIQKEYLMDQARKSPHSRHIFESLEIKAKQIIFSASKNKKDAINKAQYIHSNLDKTKKRIKDKYSNIKIRKLISKELKTQFRCASNALEQLKIENKNNTGIFAGYPWFFQFWSRDELISLKAFILNKNFTFARKIIMKYINKIAKDGRLTNHRQNNSSNKESIKTNADAIGWLFKRIQDYKEEKVFSNKDMSTIKKALLKSIKNIEQNYQEENLIKNNPLETWMDTEWGEDNRSGFNIEIQAMYLNMLKIAYDFTNDKTFKDKELKTRRIVKEKFYKENVLYDNAYEHTIRPNIFIAAYIYPNLFSDTEWEKIITNSMNSLWLKWGGISTISKTHPLFQKEHTGEIPQSYHRGDSWFWINNIAAIVMSKIDKNKFKKYIEKILYSSSKELLTMGITGAQSELTSAMHLNSQGCLNQAWSNATLIELIAYIDNQNNS